MTVLLGALAAAAAVASIALASGPDLLRLRPNRRGSTPLSSADGAVRNRRRFLPSPGTAPGGPTPWLIACVVCLVLAVVAALGPLVAGAGVVLVGAARLRAARAALKRRQRAIEVAVPDLVDLFVIAAAAGHPVHTCVVMVSDRAPAPLRPALVAARSSLSHGMPLAEALRGLGVELGVLGPSLTGAMATSAATGAPLGPALRDVAAIARDRRRRDAENDARRLPITLLFPLVCCVLPAFVLLAVVPLLAASLASLEI